LATIANLTSDILVMSLDGPSSPSIKLQLGKPVSGSHEQGWGFGWYPGDQTAAMVTKDPAALSTQVLLDAITDWSSFRSTVFFCKVRGANKGYAHHDTQPFTRSFAGRDWMFMHNGDLNKEQLEKLPRRKSGLLEPLGSTDSELVFCHLLTAMHREKIRRIADLDPHLLYEWLQPFDQLGSADMSMTDGESTACFHGSQSPKPMFYTRLQPPNNQQVYISEAAQLALSDPRDTYRTALIFSSSPFSNSRWIEMQPGQLIVARRGAVVWDSTTKQSVAAASPVLPSPQTPNLEQTEEVLTHPQSEQTPSQTLVTNVRSITHTEAGNPLAYRLFEVNHVTHYEYSEPVEHSTHFFRLQPANDAIQEVLHSSLTISTAGEEIQFEDVFGNQSLHYTINQSYAELSITAISQVKVFAAPPDDHSLSRRRTSIPLIWMPWQRQMMMPYLLPPELPESQLTELTEYAMSFVERNDYRLFRILEDINNSIYRDYQYVPGITSLHTTAFEVYTNRQGVCQDFTNLFICLARLLSVPARYRMGYIYTGSNYTNKIQSEASHAWAEVYLPYVGWRGFDPTNGCAVTQDHVRVACGRNYRDATPTSGTIFRGGGTETLNVDVKMQEIRE
jgi:transglutaminase-like putative cysteine protease/predicted glutamine amidotransferase